MLADQLRDAFLAREPVAPILHQQALDRFREYLRVGGMPEAVSHWRATGDPVGVARVHSDLSQALAEDLQKYRGVRYVAYLEAAFSHLRHHYRTPVLAHMKTGPCYAGPSCSASGGEAG